MSTLTPTGSSRRSPLPAVLAVIVALAVGAGAGWWFAGRDNGSSAAPGSTTSCSSTAHASHSAAKPVKLPDPRTILVNVYNATTRRGLARTTSVELAARGFKAGKVANDPLKKIIPTPAEIRFGASGAAAAKVVAAQVPNPTMVRDSRKDASVDFVLGEGFTSLSTVAQAHAALTARPSPTASVC